MLVSKTSWMLIAFVAALAVAGPAFALTQAGLINDQGFPQNGGDDQLDPAADVSFGPPLGNVSFQISGTLPNYTIAPNNVSGLALLTGRGDFLVPNGITSQDISRFDHRGLTDYVYFRQFLSIENISGASLQVTPTYTIGSGIETAFFNLNTPITSSGDAAVGADDMWAVIDDDTNGGPADTNAFPVPALGLVFADGTGLLPTQFVRDTVFVGRFHTTFDFTLAPGESASLMYFLVGRNQTDLYPQTATKESVRDDILALLNDNDLVFSGLTEEEALSVRNFTRQTPTANAIPEPATAGLLGLAAMGLLARRRRHAS